jgi:hypothetical protein
VCMFVAPCWSPATPSCGQLPSVQRGVMRASNTPLIIMSSKYTQSNVTPGRGGRKVVAPIQLCPGPGEGGPKTQWGPGWHPALASLLLTCWKSSQTRRQRRQLLCCASNARHASQLVIEVLGVFLCQPGHVNSCATLAGHRSLGGTLRPTA